MATQPRQIPNAVKQDKSYSDLVSPLVAESETGLHYHLTNPRESVKDQPKGKTPSR